MNIRHAPETHRTCTQSNHTLQKEQNFTSSNTGLKMLLSGRAPIGCLRLSTQPTELPKPKCCEVVIYKVFKLINKHKYLVMALKIAFINIKLPFIVTKVGCISLIP